MNPYSGMTDLIEAKGMLKKEGNSLVYTTVDGEIIKKFRKAWERNDDGCLDTVMADITNNPHIFDKSVAEDAPDIEEAAE
jgi:hypothetical protein